jgi:hypothetical protein
MGQISTHTAAAAGCTFFASAPVNVSRTRCIIGGMLGCRRWVGNPLRVAAAGCIAAAFLCARPQPSAAQALNIASSRPQWGTDAAIEADLLRDSSAREGTSHKKPPLRVLRVLMVGNSYTKFNLLHLLLSRIADNASGPRIHVDVEARGGYSLRMHLKSRTALIKIRNGHYSHVVLQGHSLSAVDHPDELAEDTERFNAAIMASGSRTVLYETWARKPNTSLYKKHALVRTFNDMVGRIDTTYSGIARKLHIELAPVGGAFVRAWRTDPAVALWGSDGSHPTLAGSYMAACVLYGAITGRDPRESTYVPFPLDVRVAANLRAVAAVSLGEVPGRPAGDVVPSINTGIAANSGGTPPELSKSSRATSVSAKFNRPSAKPPETGRVAATIADFLGRAPGQLDAPITGHAEPSAAPENAVHAAAPSADDAPARSAPARDAPTAPVTPAFLDDAIGPEDVADAPVRIF